MIASLAALLLSAPFAFAGPPVGTTAFTVSIERPSTHYVHVEFRCDSVAGESLDFKLPAWTPGYYMITDYAKNVFGFRARDGAGRPLDWEKTSKNTWRVTAEATDTVVVGYDVYAFARSVVESSVDDGQAFLSPAGLFMYVAGRIGRPVTVTLVAPPEWKRVSTGLTPVEGRPRIFAAPDFDVLYDSPILAGNQEVLPFEVRGVPHEFVGRDLGSFDRLRFVADLKAMVESAATLFGELPYTHYVFLAIGPGGGGLEHLDSQVITFSGDRLSDPAEYRKVMSFISHEYFHHFNVKRIRPVALGPFDYDRENYTDMLWVSEGFTVYYEDRILLRSGFYSVEEYLERLRVVLSRLENDTGHRYTSVAEGSFNVWSGYFGHNEHQMNTGVSFYDKGCALAALLDLAIRRETKNQKSLDDVMRTLYRTFYKEKKRGFTDGEFRAACERIAGAPLPEIFDVYVKTSADIDYARYFARAGLEIDVQPREQPGAALGAETEERDHALVVARIEPDSPASRAGLSKDDEILALNGARTDGQKLAALLKASKPGETVRILLARRGRTREVDVVLGARTERTFRITPMKLGDPLQEAIRKGWLSE
ncbi:MAG TPA: PDZ domain-containing protein [Thermoanaerobaculia bacterium]